MHKGVRTPQSMLPLSPTEFVLLIVLVEAVRHGYEIQKYVGQELGRAVSVTTLYRCIRRLDAEDIIEVDPERTAQSDDTRRRYYRLTAFGHEVLKAEIQRLAQTLHRAKAIFSQLGEA
jgi:DNA-binding PadR family transcriptional regulator